MAANTGMSQPRVGCRKRQTHFISLVLCTNPPEFPHTRQLQDKKTQAQSLSLVWMSHLCSVLLPWHRPWTLVGSSLAAAPDSIPLVLLFPGASTAAALSGPITFSSRLTSMLLPLLEHRAVLEHCQGSLFPTGKHSLMLLTPHIHVTFPQTSQHPSALCHHLAKVPSTGFLLQWGPENCRPGAQHLPQDIGINLLSVPQAQGP